VPTTLQRNIPQFISTLADGVFLRRLDKEYLKKPSKKVHPVPVRQLSSKEKPDEESIIDKKIEDVFNWLEKLENDVDKNGKTLGTINKALDKLSTVIEKYNKSSSQKYTRLRKDTISRADSLDKRFVETIELLKSRSKELNSMNENTQNQISLLKEEIPQELNKLKTELHTSFDEGKKNTDKQLENMNSMIEQLSTVFKEHTEGYTIDKSNINDQLAALGNKIATEVTNLNENISDNFKTTEDNILENLTVMIAKSAEAQEQIITNLHSANQNIQDMKETYTAEFSTQLDEFEKTYTILSELVSDFNKARESQTESSKKVSEIYDTIHWKFETLRDELSSRFEVLEGRVNDSLDQLMSNFDTSSRETEESLRTLHQTIDSLKIAYVDRLTKNLEALSLDIDTTKKAIISAIPMQSSTLDSSTLVGVKKLLENSSKDLSDKLRTLKEEQVSLVNIQANLVSTLRDYRTMLQELRITLLDKMEEFEKLMIR